MQYFMCANQCPSHCKMFLTFFTAVIDNTMDQIIPLSQACLPQKVSMFKKHLIVMSFEDKI
jgi:hypothetical protein